MYTHQDLGKRLSPFRTRAIILKIKPFWTKTPGNINWAVCMLVENGIVEMVMDIEQFFLNKHIISGSHSSHVWIGNPGKASLWYYKTYDVLFVLRLCEADT